MYLSHFAYRYYSTVWGLGLLLACYGKCSHTKCRCGLHKVCTPSCCTTSKVLCLLSLLCCAQARVTVVDMLKEKNLYRGIADNAMRLGLCSRSKVSVVDV